jgi:hypothetical protein
MPIDIENFEAISREAAKVLHMDAMRALSEKMHNGDENSVADLVKIGEFTGKRLSMFQTEKTDNLPVINWTINGAQITMEMTAPKPEPLEILEDVAVPDSPPPAEEVFIPLGNMEPLDINSLL